MRRSELLSFLPGCDGHEDVFVLDRNVFHDEYMQQERSSLVFLDADHHAELSAFIYSYIDAPDSDGNISMLSRKALKKM